MMHAVLLVSLTRFPEWNNQYSAVAWLLPVYVVLYSYSCCTTARFCRVCRRVNPVL